MQDTFPMKDWILFEIKNIMNNPVNGPVVVAWFVKPP